VPLSATVCVPPKPPTLTLSTAAFDPAVSGLNTTLMVQLPPTATDDPQVVVSEKGWGGTFESVMLVIGSATVPVFVTVIDWGTLATFNGSLPNGNEVGNAV